MPIRTKREKQLEREKALREEMIAQAKAGVQEALARKDLVLIQAIRALDDLDQAKSLLTTRLKEFVSLNFPELELSNEETYAAVAAEFGRREDFKPDKLAELVGEKSKEIMLKARKSYGASFDEEDKVAAQAFGAQVKAICEARKVLQEYVEKEAGETFKNLSYLTDPLLATRLVATAGGLQKLAMMPASTVQVIGAERALFKHLRAGTKPPKHGIIFQSAFIRGAPWSQRGKIARDLATKLAIAAKADFYTQNFIAPKLKEKFEARLKEIQALPSRPEPKPFEYERERFGGPRERPFRRFEGGAPRGPPREGGAPRGPPREGGFQPRGPPRESGYQPRGPPREGYQSRGPPREGGFQPRGPPREGSFQPRGPPREGYQPREGSFQPRGPPRESGYQPRGPPREGGYQPRGPRPAGGRPPFRGGGFQRRGPPREGGFGERRPFRKFRPRR